MFLRIIALVLITSICAAQRPTVETFLYSPSSAPQSANMAQVGNLPPATVTVPQGSLIALKLISIIKSKSTHSGDPVHAVVAFPLAIDSRVVISAGVYVEGVVDRVNAHPAGGAQPSVQLRFTRLLFPNGYSVPLVATNTRAAVPMLNNARPARAELASARDGAPYLGEAFLTPGQNPTQPPPLPSMGPSPGELAGIGIGASVGILVLAVAICHHRASSTDYVLFDSGWQFQMTLQEPLTLDTARVPAAADAY